MYLSRLIVDLRNRAARRDIADCQQMHRTIMASFPQSSADDARAYFGVLYRQERHSALGQEIIVVQSKAAPDWSHLPAGYLVATGENPACKPVEAQYAKLQAGMTLTFRLRANPTRKVDTKSGENGERRNGRRVPVRGEEEQVRWLSKKGAEGGFALLYATATAGAADLRAKGARGGAALHFDGVLFEGQLRVTDPVRFRQTLAEGVGPAKAYGFGLLSVAPVRA